MEPAKWNVSSFKNVTICHGMTTDLYFHILKWVRKLYADHNKENEKYVFLLNVLCIYVYVWMYVHVNTITPLHIHERSCTLQQTCTHTKLQIREKKENKTKPTFWVHSGIVWQHNNNNNTTIQSKPNHSGTKRCSFRILALKVDKPNLSKQKINNNSNINSSSSNNNNSIGKCRSSSSSS